MRIAVCAGVLCVAAACGSGERAEALRPTGDPCSWGMQCEGGMCIAESVGSTRTGFSDGTCTELCIEQPCSVGDVCVDLRDGLYCLPACGGESGECRPGYVCHSLLGACFPSCKNTGCPGGMQCLPEGECGYEAATLTVLGGPCAGDSECQTGYCVTAFSGGEFTGWHSGMCVQPCTDDGCPDGSEPVVLGQEPWCLPACLPDAPCREGYVCSPVAQACLPDCTLGWMCGEGYLCMADGTCQVDWAELNPLGGPCDADFDCASGWCAEETEVGVPTGWKGGMCTLPCGAGCPLGTGCMVFLGEGICMPVCPPGSPPSSGCRDGYICDPYVHMCLPDCRNEGWDCGDHFNCNGMGVCIPAG